jgi:hypothetical protein
LQSKPVWPLSDVLRTVSAEELLTDLHQEDDAALKAETVTVSGSAGGGTATIYVVNPLDGAKLNPIDSVTLA